MNRALLVLTPCAVETKPGILCGAPPAGVDLAHGKCLCQTHLAAAARIQRDAERLDDLPEPQRTIEAAYSILRANDAELRRKLERGEL